MKTYAAPAAYVELSPSPPLALLDSLKAPTTIVSPSMATEVPNPSYPSAFDALRYACWVQLLPERVKTYAAPAEPAELSPSPPLALLASPDAPTTTVSPLIATE